MMITLEVIDAVRGAAASRISAELDLFITGHGWKEVGHGVTNDEGRILHFGEPAAPGIYRLMLDVASQTSNTCFPSITVTFEVHDAGDGCHLHLLLSTFGYTVYRA